MVGGGDTGLGEVRVGARERHADPSDVVWRRMIEDAEQIAALVGFRLIKLFTGCADPFDSASMRRFLKGRVSYDVLPLSFRLDHDGHVADGEEQPRHLDAERYVSSPAPRGGS